MHRTKFKKLLVLLMVFCMTVTYMPSYAFAETSPNQADIPQAELETPAEEPQEAAENTPPTVDTAPAEDTQSEAAPEAETPVEEPQPAVEESKKEEPAPAKEQAEAIETKDADQAKTEAQPEEKADAEKEEEPAEEEPEEEAAEDEEQIVLMDGTDPNQGDVETIHVSLNKRLNDKISKRK